MKCFLCSKVKTKFYTPKMIKLKRSICLACKHECKVKSFSKKLLRYAVLKAYGNGKCACCGESQFEFLTLDHINGFKLLKDAFNLKNWSEYRFLVSEGFPYKDRYRVLCMNCNWSLGVKGYCPHSLGSNHDSILNKLV